MSKKKEMTEEEIEELKRDPVRYNKYLRKIRKFPSNGVVKELSKDFFGWLCILCIPLFIIIIVVLVLIIT